MWFVNRFICIIMETASLMYSLRYDSSFLSSGILNLHFTHKFICFSIVQHSVSTLRYNSYSLSSLTVQYHCGQSVSSPNLCAYLLVVVNPLLLVVLCSLGRSVEAQVVNAWKRKEKRRREEDIKTEGKGGRGERINRQYCQAISPPPSSLHVLLPLLSLSFGERGKRGRNLQLFLGQSPFPFLLASPAAAWLVGLHLASRAPHWFRVLLECQLAPETLSLDRKSKAETTVRRPFVRFVPFLFIPRFAMKHNCLILYFPLFLGLFPCKEEKGREGLFSAEMTLILLPLL